MAHRVFSLVFIFIRVLCVFGDRSRRGCLCGPTEIMFGLRSPDSSTDFDKLTDFVVKVVSTFDLGAQSARIGLLTFADSVHEDVPLSMYTDKSALLDAVKKTTHFQGGTRTDLAIKYAREIGFAASTRNRAIKIMIIITDRLSNDPDATNTEAVNIRHDDVTVFAIRVGPYANDSDLIQLASDPTYRHIYTVSKYDYLIKIEGQLEQRICETSCMRGGPDRLSYDTNTGTSAKVFLTTSRITTRKPGCSYKGKLYHRGQSWLDGCDYICQCIGESNGYYTCIERCAPLHTIPSNCQLVIDARDSCCQRVYCSYYADMTTKTQLNVTSNESSVSSVPSTLIITSSASLSTTTSAARESEIRAAYTTVHVVICIIIGAVLFILILLLVICRSSSNITKVAPTMKNGVKSNRNHSPGLTSVATLDF